MQFPFHFFEILSQLIYYEVMKHFSVFLINPIPPQILLHPCRRLVPRLFDVREEFMAEEFHSEVFLEHDGRPHMPPVQIYVPAAHQKSPHE